MSEKSCFSLTKTEGPSSFAILFEDLARENSVLADRTSLILQMYGKSTKSCAMKTLDPVPHSQRRLLQKIRAQKTTILACPRLSKSMVFPRVPRGYPGCTRGTAGPLPAARCNRLCAATDLALQQIVCCLLAVPTQAVSTQAPNPQVAPAGHRICPCGRWHPAE